MTPQLSALRARLESLSSSSSSSSGPTPSPRAPPETTEDTPSSPYAFHDKPTRERLDEVVRQHLISVCLVITAPTPDKPNGDWGTGCLIRGGLLLTNAHVISSKEEARKATISFIRIISENLKRKVVTFEAVDPIQLDPDALWMNSPSAGKDARGELQHARFGALDYTLVAIKPHSFVDSIQRHAFSIFEGVEIEKNRDICVLQHPKIHPRKGGHTYGASYWTDGVVGKKIDSCFIHYNAHTVGGSSGGAVVSGENGRLLALHYQGEMHCGCHEIHEKCNAGVNINAIVADLFSQQADVVAKIEERAREIDLRYQQAFVNQLCDFYNSKYKSDDHSKREWYNPGGKYTDLMIIGGEANKEENEIELFTDRQTHIREAFYKPEILISIQKLFVQQGLSESSQKRAIIYGGAGVGKSAFSEMAALDGLNHWPQFSSIIVIQLRNLNAHNYPNLHLRDYSIEEILAREHGGSLRESGAASFSDIGIDFKEFLKGKLVDESLLILDGFDELPPEMLSESGSLKNVLNQLLSAFDHILITSRPGAFFHMHSIQSWPKFEIKGFDEVGIDSFIRNFYQQLEERREISEEDAKKKIEKLQERLKCIPTLHNLVQTPLYLAFACLMFNDNDTIFDAGATFSLTRLYYEMVNRSYSNFLLHPGPLQLLKHDPREDLASHSSIQPIDQVFQCIAWEMMREESLQIPDLRFTAILHRKKLKYDPDLFKTCGLIKCENRAWEFNHLTFQEYFAAVYLARLFIDEREKEDGQNYLSKIKFNLAYKLVLSMAAGYLSIVKDSKALNRFFNDLRAEPRDLAISYELGLFAQCFEECEAPNQINGHSDFIQQCIDYISMDTPRMGIFDLLSCSDKLFHHLNVVETIVKLLSIPNRTLNILSTIEWITRDKQTLPEILFNQLICMVKNDFPDKKEHLPKLIRIFANTALQKGERSRVAANALMDIVEDEYLDEKTKAHIAWALIKIFNQQQELLDIAPTKLKSWYETLERADYRKLFGALNRNPEHAETFSDATTHAIVKMVRDETALKYTTTEQPLLGEEVVINALVNLIKEEDSPEPIIVAMLAVEGVVDKWDAVWALVTIALQKETLFRAIVDILMRMINDTKTCGIAAWGLGSIALRKGELPIEIPLCLIEKLRDEATREGREHIVWALTQIALQEGELIKDIIEVLAKIVSDPSIGNDAIEGLKEIAEARKLFSEVALQSLIDAYVNRDSSNKGPIVDILEKVSFQFLLEISERRMLEVVVKVCYLTQRVCFINDSCLLISDQGKQTCIKISQNVDIEPNTIINNKTFIRCPDYISETVEGITTSATSSSSSSSCSSSSGHNG